MAFVTLLERKILGYSQLRKGPNKVRIAGIAQPFNDAIKLFSKEIVFPRLSNRAQFALAPVCALFIVLAAFIFFPIKEHTVSIRFTVIFLYMILRMNVYPVLISGWASNSKYALVGALRAVAQTVSYEVSLAIIFIFFFALVGRFNMLNCSATNAVWSKVFIFAPMTGIWLISCMAETNRTPFDFAEGESELVSGFNIEYGRLGFALIFMAEYGRIILMRILFSLVFISHSLRPALYLASTFLVFVWVWVRTTFPRYRYDKLMNLAWKIYLPLSIALLVYIIALVAG